ncbi:MAG: hypothetical protein JXA92_00300 [candidate division Zixibacteria bacterium]|nr:hypothetical protein [candidate division Zixibacteria bacterium]
MREVVIQIPTLEAEQNIEIDVKINGRKRTIKYRVEIIDWEEDEKPAGEKIEVLRHVIKEHEKGWELIQIGAPTRGNVPIMFRQKMPQTVEDGH